MKRLITAESVRQAAQEGKKQIEAVIPECIVTPEARMVAEELGVELTEVLSNVAVCGNAKPSAPAAQVKVVSSGACQTQSNVAVDDDVAKIRAAVIAQLPPNSVPSDVIDQLVRKLMGEKNLGTVSDNTDNNPIHVTKQRIKRVKGNSVQMGLFEEAGKENQIGLADVITAADGSSMAAGFMSWKNCFFPWTLNYDEVDIVLEGELHIVCGGETSIAKAGDVIFIPKNSSIQFGTPSSVRFFFVTYPANYLEQ
ncbi:ethanolamine utilization acetate kinase EutQ [Neisseria sp. Ec49-e6-T10]|uniref:ethanolamine utilization acetate kinase EutQ n=1 Tax=Neisseria sp. Ec49-e6-T10 TaxID=3140744 RepID=UPI003EC15585